MPFGIQPIHLIVVVVVALLVFGPQKLPEIGRGLGKAINEFKEGTREMTDVFREEVTPVTQATPARIAHAHDSHVIPGVTCPNCSATNLQGATYCSHCGSRITPVVAVEVCPNCKAENPQGVTFCNKCGSRMALAPVIETSAIVIDRSTEAESVPATVSAVTGETVQP